MPPDLGKPYSTEAERAADRERLLAYWYGVDSLVQLAGRPAARWSPEQLQLFESRDSQEHPAHRLQRWRSLYEEEISAIRDVRNRLVHTGRISDPELRGATWLARSIISTALGILPGEVEPRSIFALTHAVEHEN